MYNLVELHYNHNAQLICTPILSYTATILTYTSTMLSYRLQPSLSYTTTILSYTSIILSYTTIILCCNTTILHKLHNNQNELKDHHSEQNHSQFLLHSGLHCMYTCC